MVSCWILYLLLLGYAYGDSCSSLHSGEAIIAARNEQCWRADAFAHHSGYLSCSEFCIRQTGEYLRVYDGLDDTYPLLLEVQGCTDTVRIRGTQRYMYITWSSSHHLQLRSFTCLFTKEVNCKTVKNGDIITSGNYPRNYDNEEDSCWNFDPYPYQQGQLTCDQFVTASRSDVLTVYSGGTGEDGVELAKYYGSHTTIDVRAPRMFITWKTNSHGTAQGFVCNLAAQGSLIAGATTTPSNRKTTSPLYTKGRGVTLSIGSGSASARDAIGGTCNVVCLVISIIVSVTVVAVAIAVGFWCICCNGCLRKRKRLEEYDFTEHQSPPPTPPQPVRGAWDERESDREGGSEGVMQDNNTVPPVPPPASPLEDDEQAPKPEYAWGVQKGSPPPKPGHELRPRQPLPPITRPDEKTEEESSFCGTEQPPPYQQLDPCPWALASGVTQTSNSGEASHMGRNPPHRLPPLMSPTVPSHPTDDQLYPENQERRTSFRAPPDHQLYGTD